MSQPILGPFNQGSLQDFDDCRRRFYLRHILHLAWPAIETQPALENERFMKQGAAFHRMIHQYWIGVPEDRLSEMNQEPDLQFWWQNFINHASKLPGLVGEGIRRFPEITLTMSLEGQRLVAKYDLIVYLPEGRWMIYDWKTSRHQSRRDRLAVRWQTRLYPFLLTHAGSQLLAASTIGQKADLQPDQISFLYWFPAFPETPLSFPYSASQFRRDRDDLASLLRTIMRLAAKPSPESFPLTPDENNCKFCIYRSLCDRGIQAGAQEVENNEEENDLLAINFDFDQVAETEF